MDRVIVCEFRKWEYFNLIVLMIICVETKVMFKDLVLAFRLTVRLRVVGGAQSALRLHIVAK
jgi:hypothetical protein